MQIIKKSYFNLTRNIFIAVVLCILLFGGGYFLGYKGFLIESSKYPDVNISRQLPPEKSDLDFNLFWKVWDTIQSKYYDKTKLIPYKMVYGAIQGMVASIDDPYTVFLPPQQNKIIEEDLKGNFEGVGIQLGYIGTQLAVIAPLFESPAEKAGVKAGDLIVEIIDENKNIDVSTAGMSINDAVQLIRGDSGTNVKLILLREGINEPILTEITRKKIEVPSVSLKILPNDMNGDIAHIRVTKFGSDTQNEWDEVVVDILKNPDIKFIVVDVRNNPGGYLQGAVELSSDFLDQGQTAVIEESGDGEKVESKIEKLGRLKKYMTVVLINKGSASASEIFAGALRDNKKIKLIGDTSFGKGTIQEPEQINGGAGLHITIAKWLTPGRLWVHGVGLKPDFEIKNDPITNEDEQLTKAIEIVKSL